METTTKPQKTGGVGLIAADQKIENLLKQPTISRDDLEPFNSLERKRLAETCTAMLAKLKDTERDDFFAKIDAVITPFTKSDIWYYNHAAITDAISALMLQYGTMPGRKEIAEKTGLSRQTINKHLKEYHRQPQFAAGMEQFSFMAPSVLTSVFKSALKGDTKAARLYLEITGAVNKSRANTVINEQNNYIQINNTILSQENLNQLTAEQLNQIESIVLDRR
ncbi:helix-turn-helix domain-containing protein [Mucilaginibacter boryungensis]|uniref:Uncharacterized protein n=1 Tax=Mucilaginibacter boryungensis TaxID=768480 RepID=A0ABR9XGV7_9SPHI|nr:hypothetical protein [Mucilaginibacter boryungensis]MBE9666238.1 hypothetical protein [Mucilaginibacter boryungensis]